MISKTGKEARKAVRKRLGGRRGGLRSALLLFSFLAATLLLLAGNARAEHARVEDIRYHVKADHTRVVLDLTAPLKERHFKLEGPERFCLDLEGGVLSEKIVETLQVEGGRISRIRSGQYRPDTARIVLELDEARDVKVFALDSPARLVVDVYGGGKDIKAGTTGSAAPSSSASSPAPPPVSLKKIIVIDAGHGGKDPGAVGRGKLLEKNVTLDIARRLKRLLEKNPDFEVHLTRDKDVYLELKERTEIANRLQADIFVSIHVNANRSSRIKGLETYLLNWTNDKESMRVAARENKISYERMQQKHNALGVILASLERQSKRDDSLQLAHNVQRGMVNNLSRSYSGIKNLGVKQALFYVLLDARMPSVLAEVSFISNRTEEERLRSGTYRQRIAQGLANGITRYLTSAPDGVQELARH